MMIQRASSALLLVVLALTACTPPQTQDITLVFYSQSDLQNAVMDSPVVVTRTLPASDDAMDSALRLLFAGPTQEEQGRGAYSSLDLEALASSYIDVRVEGGVAIVNFRPAALQILNSAAARQFMAKEPIQRTLLQFPGITDVQYAIDGELFDEWDA
jgi:spore germination protein GerM